MLDRDEKGWFVKKSGNCSLPENPLTNYNSETYPMSAPNQTPLQTEQMQQFQAFLEFQNQQKLSYRVKTWLTDNAWQAIILFALGWGACWLFTITGK